MSGILDRLDGIFLGTPIGYLTLIIKLNEKLISILGSTGSIGLTTLKIIEKKKNLFQPYFFSANKNHELIRKQIKKYKYLFFLISNEKVFKKVKNDFKHKKTKVLNKFPINEIKKKSDITISAIPGIAGLSPTISMIKRVKKFL